MTLDVDKLVIDWNGPRVEPRTEIVAQMAGDLRSGDTLPPIKVYKDGDRLLVVDGISRVLAHRKEGKSVIEAEVIAGCEREAYLFALAAGGLTLGERRRAAKRLLSDPEWGTWSIRVIARRCGISDKAISELRAETKTPRRPAPEPPRKGRPVKTIDQLRSERTGLPRSLSTKAWLMVRALPQAAEVKFKRELAALAPTMQMLVARRLRDGESSTVKEAVAAIAKGAPTDSWSRAYAALSALTPDDRARMCRLVLAEATPAEATPKEARQ